MEAVNYWCPNCGFEEAQAPNSLVQCPACMEKTWVDSESGEGWKAWVMVEESKYPKPPKEDA